MTAPATIPLPDWPRLMPVSLAAQYLGLGESTLRERGPAPRKVGTRSLWDRRDLDRWADALTGQPLEQNDRKAEAAEIDRRIAERLHGSR